MLSSDKKKFFCTGLLPQASLPSIPIPKLLHLDQLPALPLELGTTPSVENNLYQIMILSIYIVMRK